MCLVPSRKIRQYIRETGFYSDWCFVTCWYHHTLGLWDAEELTSWTYRRLVSLSQSFSKVSFIVKFMLCLTDLGRSKPRSVLRTLVPWWFPNRKMACQEHLGKWAVGKLFEVKCLCSHTWIPLESEITHCGCQINGLGIWWVEQNIHIDGLGNIHLWSVKFVMKFSDDKSPTCSSSWVL